jgi:outer membrane lipoprotein LolB
LGHGQPQTLTVWILLKGKHMTLIRLLGLAFLFLGLTSCATLTPTQEQTPQNKKVTWDSRVQTLSGIQSWDIKALIAIRQAENGGTANMQWRQQSKNYHIALFGPLGSHSVELTGQPGHVELAEASGKKVTASSPEELLAKQLGWRIPVSNLYYWVRGIPVPGMAAEKKLDSFNHLIALQQDGWTIRYLRYTSQRNIDVPDKIFLNNPQLSVKIAISQWRF